MKVLAIVLLCAFATVQGRSASVLNNIATRAELGENPWIVHLRVAVATGGDLRHCAGSFIGGRWVLTAASCVRDERFTWVSLGLVSSIQPSVVLETSTNHAHPVDNLALINLNRPMESSANIRPVQYLGNSVPRQSNFCTFGRNADGGPGEILNCFNVFLQRTPSNDIIATSLSGATASQHDLGAPLVNAENVQIGVLTSTPLQNAGVFIQITASHGTWIQGLTGIRPNY